jgi:hypothetical protein
MVSPRATVGEVHLNADGGRFCAGKGTTAKDRKVQLRGKASMTGTVPNTLRRPRRC